MARVDLYVRVSRVAGREGDSFQSPKVQEEVTRANAASHQDDVAEVVEELDASGGTMDRKGLQRIIDRIKSGEVDGVIVARLDRFARTVSGGLAAIEEIHAAGGFVRVVEGGIDTSKGGGAGGRFQLQIFLALAEWQRTVACEYLEVSKSTAVARGVHISGVVPTGYVRPEKGAPLAVDPGPASDAIREAFRLRATGLPVAEVCRILDERFPGGASGRGRWTVAAFRNIFRNRVYLGEARQGKHVKPEAHPALTKPETFETVQALGQRQRTPRKHPALASLLGGIVRCASCEYAMASGRANTSAKTGTSYYVYRCRGKNAAGCNCRASAMRVALDDFVQGEVLVELKKEADAANADVAKKRAKDETAELRGLIASARLKLDPFENPDYVAIIGTEAAARAAAKVNREIARLTARLGDAVAASHDGGEEDVADVLARWDSTSLEGKRDVVARMVESVMVSRAPRSTPLADRVKINWRGVDALPVTALPRLPRNEDEVEARILSA